MQGSSEEKEQANLVLLEVLEAARIVAVMLVPIAPVLARRVYQQLGFSDQQFESLTWADTQWGGEHVYNDSGLCKMGGHAGMSSHTMFVVLYLP